ncbi:MAG: hypothetical protein JO199_13740 [Candidatus Eremiobacteraeota bacterium]|nr:hypothetical protein [Candidatus Eremiobacteraeota bacterium]
MEIGDVLEGMDFGGETFAPASIVCDTRDGELAVVVAQAGEDVEVRYFSNPLEIHGGKTDDFAAVESNNIACVGFVVDLLESDEAHTAKAIGQLSKLMQKLPSDLIDLIRGTAAG